MVCLLTKHYIYVTRCQNATLKLEDCLKKICQIVKMEEYMSRQNEKVEKFVTKWEKFINYLEMERY